MEGWGGGGLVNSLCKLGRLEVWMEDGLFGWVKWIEWMSGWGGLGEERKE